MLQMLHLINKSLKFVELSLRALVPEWRYCCCCGYFCWDNMRIKREIYIYIHINGSAGVLHNANDCLENLRVPLTGTQILRTAIKHEI